MCRPRSAITPLFSKLQVMILMRTHSSPEVEVKAAGGVRTLEDTLKVMELGVTRIGATATETIILAVEGEMAEEAPEG